MADKSAVDWRYGNGQKAPVEIKPALPKLKDPILTIGTVGARSMEILFAAELAYSIGTRDLISSFASLGILSTSALYDAFLQTRRNRLSEINEQRSHGFFVEDN